MKNQKTVAKEAIADNLIIIYIQILELFSILIKSDG